MTLLWDIQKFFDSIDIEVLFEEAEQIGFPVRQLTCSMIVHHAPRLLRLGSSIGQVIAGMGRSILAGCKRSTHFARVYTIRMVRHLHQRHQYVKLYQHVDDISNLITAATKQSLVLRGSLYATDFKAWTDYLRLQISGKSVALPDTTEARRLVRICNKHGIKIKSAREGVDIGIGTSAATKRTTAKLRKRVNATRKRAKRCGVLSRCRVGARRLALTGVHLGQSYGSTVVGMSPTMVTISAMGQRRVCAEDMSACGARTAM